MTETTIEPRHLLNAQTGKISWDELVRHFARGVVICVEPENDLVDMAERLVKDQADEVGDLVEQGLLHRAQDEDAIRWTRETPEFWAVVVAPWVLVQEIRTNLDDE